MKSISLLIFVFLLSWSAMAQINTDSTNGSMNKNNATMNNRDSKSVHEFYAMRNGKLVKIKNKIKTDQTDNVTLDDGTIISSNGQVQHKDGTTEMLKEGEWIDDSGKIHEGRMNQGNHMNHMNMNQNKNWKSDKGKMKNNRMNYNKADSSWKNQSDSSWNNNRSDTMK
jgi:hypothetical protein